MKRSASADHVIIDNKNTSVKDPAKASSLSQNQLEATKEEPQQQLESEMGEDNDEDDDNSNEIVIRPSIAATSNRKSISARLFSIKK